MFNARIRFSMMVLLAVAGMVIALPIFYPAADSADQTTREKIVSNITSSRSEELKKRLTPLQFHVTQEAGTEPPFKNQYWNEKREGLYVDVVSGEVLFSSNDKFDSGCGWPSFTGPLEGSHLVERKDLSLGMIRTEVRSGEGDSHLGHVFDDGPRDRGGSVSYTHLTLPTILRV